jgi:hypothetical protein
LGGLTPGVQKLLDKAKFSNDTKGKAIIYTKSGGFIQAQQDFYALNPKNVKIDTNGTIYGQLEDGTWINVRKISTDKEQRPTLEIKSKKPQKIRYDQ